jgi:hydrogenase small subunit
VDINDPLEEIGDAWGTVADGVVADVKDLLVGELPLGTNGLPAGPGTFPFGYICHSFNMTVMASCSDLAVDHLASVVNGVGPFALLVEGTTPLAKQGRNCFVFDDPHGHVTVNDAYAYHPTGPETTMAKALQWMGSKAAFIINIGTCSAYGGIPGAHSIYTDTTAVDTATAMGLMKQYLDPSLNIPPIINVPGCPPNPDWMIYPVAHWLIHSGTFPTVNTLPGTPIGSPTAQYTQIQCELCSKNNIPALPGMDGWQDGCLRSAGCLGPWTYANCSDRQWNRFDDAAKNNWCVGNRVHDRPGNPSIEGAGDCRMPCHGCVQPSFPDMWYGKYKGFFGGYIDGI